MPIASSRKAFLAEVTGKNRYCGPTAMATVLGISTDEASALIREQTGKRSARGVAVIHLVDALQASGCKVARFYGAWRPEDRPTVAAWLRDGGGMAGGIPRDKHVILVHGNHYGTILGGRYLCPLTHRRVVPLKDLPKRRARVEQWLIVEALPEVPRVLPKVRAPDSERKAREAAKRLMSRYNIEVERDDGSLIVWGLPGLVDDDQDPYAGDHYASDWRDALERVQVYAELAQKLERDLPAQKAGAVQGAN